MVKPTQNQQAKFGKPTESRLAFIYQCAGESVFSQGCVRSCSPIEKFNNMFSDNSMSKAGMEFFVFAISVLIKAPKQNQVPAWF